MTTVEQYLIHGAKVTKHTLTDSKDIYLYYEPVAKNLCFIYSSIKDTTLPIYRIPYNKITDIYVGSYTEELKKPNIPKNNCFSIHTKNHRVLNIECISNDIRDAWINNIKSVYINNGKKVDDVITSSDNNSTKLLTRPEFYTLKLYEQNYLIYSLLHHLMTTK